jgi:hypothetical protein
MRKLLEKHQKHGKYLINNDMTNTFSIYMNASTLKNHCVWKPRDPLNLDYLKVNVKKRKKLSTKRD